MCYYYGYQGGCTNGRNDYYGDCCMSEGWAVFLWILFSLFWVCVCIAIIK